MKYVLYALGEILIVIIGILIAIQIDGWNQKRQVKGKIDSLLLEISTNLINEVEEAGNVVDFYISRDSIIQRVLEKEVTRVEFASPDINSPQYAIMILSHMSFNRNAYDNLIQISDEIPSEYNSLYKNLTNLYDGAGELIKERRSKLEAKYYPFQEYLRYNKDWFFDFVKTGALTNEAVDYFLTDPVYFNQVIEIQDDIIKYRDAIDLYKMRAKEIGNQLVELDLIE